jgi:hypothetical protein
MRTPALSDEGIAHTSLFCDIACNIFSPMQRRLLRILMFEVAAELCIAPGDDRAPHCHMVITILCVCVCVCVCVRVCVRV